MSESVRSESTQQGCEETGRRKFLSRLSVTLGAIGAALVAIPSIGFLLGLRKAPQVWRTVGKLNDFRLGDECGADGSQRDAEPAQKFSPACFLTALLCAFGSDALA
ncbi:MAG: hypothetical protein ACLPWF_16565, partial [Bryobacteraceae bacterium]